MFEQSDHIARGLSSVRIAHKENWLSVGKFYKSICAKSHDFVKVVQYADSLTLRGPADSSTTPDPDPSR